MTKRFLALVLLAALPWIARADEQAYTNRATELHERAAADAPTLAALPQDTPVKVLARGGGWTRVEAGGKSGWVRVFHLRFASTVESSPSSGGGLASLGSALGFGQRNEQARLATTGIRGLSTEDVKNANPDPAALERMQSFRADRPGAERFAHEAKLVEARVAAPQGSSPGESK
jgi:hypothetical protein